jgi:hypothetical protein
LRTELDKLNESRKQAGADQSLKAQDEYNFNKTNLENRIKLEADRAAQSRAGIETEIGLQKTLKAEDKFKRLPLSYDPIYIKSWKDNLIKNILNNYLTCVAEDCWPEISSSCNKFNRLTKLCLYGCNYYFYSSIS